jgi:tripartite-type tricarboxylate transporter receptor subunit TctC
MKRRTLLQSAPALLGLPGRLPGQAIRYIVPVAAGGGSDMVGPHRHRALGQGAQAEFCGGQPERRRRRDRLPATARAAPDGYTLMQGYVATHGTSPATRKVPYDADQGFTPIGMIGATPNVLVVNAKLPMADQGVHRLRAQESRQG